MKKQKFDILNLLKAGLLSFIFSGLWGASLLAQTVKQTYVDSDATHYYDIKITSGFEYLYLEAKGADGGKKTGTELVHNGGEGARAFGYVKIGDGTGEIPAGSTLRLIPGEAGESWNHFAGGGGGTAVAFKRPQANDAWQLLLVAGGGGGAGIMGSGKAGTTYSYGLDGNDGQGSELHNKGKDGNGGTHEGYQAYPGGGAFSDGGGGCPGRAGMQNNVPVGGMGGSTDCGDKVVIRGGFGFGGGGSGISAGKGTDKDEIGGGGGGGGYSGGGGGQSYHDWNVLAEYGGGPGGGGGSYVNTDWFFIQSLQSFNTTNDPQHGYVRYSLLKTMPIQLAKDQTKCIDLANGNTARGTNIQLVQCKGNPAQQWIMQGATIRLAENLNKCIDLTSSNTANGTNIQLWDCNDTDAQHWIYDVANQMIRSRINFNKCIDLVNGNTTGGTNIQLYDCVYGNTKPNQQWVLDNVPSAMPTATNQRIHVVAVPNKCLDVANYNIANSTNIQLSECKDHPAQYFTFDGRTIKLQAHQDKCLDLSLSQTDNGKNIQLFDCNGTDAQNWIYDGFTKAFRSAIDPGKCLDVTESNFTNATNIQLWECNNTDAQQFEIY